MLSFNRTIVGGAYKRCVGGPVDVVRAFAGCW